jgi:hypothetical protein
MDACTTFGAIHAALSKSDVAYASLSWGGFNLVGDPRSIREVERLMSVEARCKAIEAELLEYRKR